MKQTRRQEILKEKSVSSKMTELLRWIDEWDIEDAILEKMAEDEITVDEAVEFIGQWFDGWGEADAIYHFYSFGGF